MLGSTKCCVVCEQSEMYYGFPIKCQNTAFKKEDSNFGRMVDIVNRENLKAAGRRQT